LAELWATTAVTTEGRCLSVVAVFADEAELARAVLVVPHEVSVGPHVDAVLVSAGVVRLICRPVCVVHAAVCHVVVADGGAVLSSAGAQLPDERVQLARVEAVSGRPDVVAIAGLRVAVTVPLHCSHAARGNITCTNVRRILVRGINAPLPPTAKKILKISSRNGAF